MTAKPELHGAHFLSRIAASRPPDFTIKRRDGIYLSRWWVIPRNRFFNIYLHRFDGDDEDRALHDHPWVNCSVILSGSYIEHRILRGGVHSEKRYSAGAVKFRLPRSAHRISLIERPTWTLFITGPVVRTWGFHCPRGWRPWREFVDERDIGSVGRGCE